MKDQKRVLLILIGCILSISVNSQGILIDRNCAKLEPIPASAIENAKQTLHIAYGHTSHGSQLTDGMTGLIGQTNLIGYKGDIYDWNNGGTDGALDIHDYFGSGDLGHNGDTTWAPPTRTYLNNNPDVNVVIYSWCGGCSDNTYDGIQTYLDKMTELEEDYPNVTFVYMTGHTDIWSDATLKANNQHIRDYCNTNNKILYDFADIERYDPDGTYYEFVNDNCNYYDDGSGTNLLGNWATEWQDTHEEGVYWYNCSSAHTQPLNGNLKAYAAWWMWCRIAGWDGTVENKDISENTVKVFPNPIQNECIVNYDNSEFKNAQLNIYDLTGKRVFTDQVNKGSKRINTESFGNGFYILEILKGSERYTKKITIMK